MTSKSASPPEFASPKKKTRGKFLGPRGLREMWVVNFVNEGVDAVLHGKIGWNWLVYS